MGHAQVYNNSGLLLNRDERYAILVDVAVRVALKLAQEPDIAANLGYFVARYLNQE